jgi:predicted nucleotidyltransferase
MATIAPTPALPPPIARILDGFVLAARETLGDNLRSVLLFGGAAESRLRSSSDVNLIVVLERFDAASIDLLREPYRLAQAAIPLHALFLLRSEIPAAAEAFAAKFDDVKRRRRVLYGEDPFAELEIPRAALEARLKQVLLNTSLRLRAVYVERGLREEQLARAVAEAAPPLRSAAAALLELEQRPAPSSREALERVVRELGDPALREAVARLPEARERGFLPPGVAGPTLLRLSELAGRLHSRAAGVDH